MTPAVYSKRRLIGSEVCSGCERGYRLQPSLAGKQMSEPRHECRDREIRLILQQVTNEFRDLNDTSKINAHV